MKLEEAATILGVSLDDITLDGLKQTYKKLAVTCDPEKSKDTSSKNKYMQISEAYQKLNSIMEGTGNYHGDDSHEIAAFMRMFMDMVGISESDSIPAAMTFGMMFGGSGQNTNDEWSTDDDDDDDDEDDEDEYDDEDDEYIPDEYFNEYAAAANQQQANKSTAVDTSRDPHAKKYSNTNLKDKVSKSGKQRAESNQTAMNVVPVNHSKEATVEAAGEDGNNEEGEEAIGLELSGQDEEKRLKLAKKRAEKRKKQKEKKAAASIGTSEAAGGTHPNEEGVDGVEDKGSLTAATARQRLIDFLSKGPSTATSSSSSTIASSATCTPGEGDASGVSERTSEELQTLIKLNAEEIIEDLGNAVINGQLGRVNQILSYDFADELPNKDVADELISLLKNMLPSCLLVHQCVTGRSDVPPTAASGDAKSASGSSSGTKVAGDSNNSSSGSNTTATTAIAGNVTSVADGMGSTTSNLALNTALQTTIAARKLEVARYLLNYRTPSFDLSAVDKSGLSALHYAIAAGDLKVAQLIIRACTAEGAAGGTSSSSSSSGQIFLFCSRGSWIGNCSRVVV
mmetsp:Transcript_6289/g.10441  ORF Transcript_6289/g.10441 Transcript_6289/m.10441 type:complete len:568 (-) Transcript_6289:66-1769(-)